MPSKEDLEKWAKWMDSWQDLSGDKSKLRPGVLAAFLRSPELAEALATYEAVKWAELHGAEIHLYGAPPDEGQWKARLNSSRNRHRGEAVMIAPTLPEAVTALKARLESPSKEE